VDIKPAEAPKYVDRPSAADSNNRPSADHCPCDGVDAPKNTFKAIKPKRRHALVEARVIYQLYRHGIHW
jgi:hypothetical protein